MTYNISNPCSNPPKLTRRQKKAVHNASQVCRQTPIKPENSLGNGFTSSYTKFMVEFQAGKDKTPKSFESWTKVMPTGIDENTGEITWTARKTLPSRSPLAGITRPSAEKRALLAKKVLLVSADGLRETRKCDTEIRDPTDAKNMQVFEKHHVDHADN